MKCSLKSISFLNNLVYYYHSLTMNVTYANAPTFTTGVYNPPKVVMLNNIPIPTFTRYVKISVSQEHMKYVIGTQGYYFNAITRCSGAMYIWYHKDKGVIEIVGCLGALANAEARFYAPTPSKMDKVCVYVCECKK